jgi:hypothetical protein
VGHAPPGSSHLVWVCLVSIVGDTFAGKVANTFSTWSSGFLVGYSADGRFSAK